MTKTKGIRRDVSRVRVSASSVPLADTAIARAMFDKRQAAGLSLRDAAVASGISWPTLQRLETTTKRTSVATLMRVSQWTGVSMDTLAARDKAKRAK